MACGDRPRGYGAGMNFQEVLAALPELSPEERDWLRVRLAELAGEEGRDADELSAEEKALIEERSAAHESNPAAAVPVAVIEAKLAERRLAKLGGSDRGASASPRRKTP